MQFPVAKPGHGPLFFRRLHLAVQEADFVLGEDVRLQMGGQFGRRPRLKFFVFFNQAANDIRLPAFFEEAAQRFHTPPGAHGRASSAF